MTTAPFSLSRPERLLQALARPGLVPVLTVCLAGAAAYCNTFSASFHFDDVRNIVANPILRDLRYFIDPSAAADFSGYQDFKLRYIGFLSFAINYRLHGLELIGYHLSNLLIHLINASLVYFLTLQIFRAIETPVEIIFPGASTIPRNDSRERLIAFFASLLFAVHPIQTQAVTYIVQRFASLAATFYLLSILAYCGWRISSPLLPRLGGSYVFSLACAVLAVKTKEIAVSLPIMLVLYETILIRKGALRLCAFLLPYFLIVLLVPLSAVDIWGEGALLDDLAQKSKILTEMSRTDYLLTQLTVVVTYLRLIILPVAQNFDYDYPVYRTLFNFDVMLSLFIIIALVLTGVLMVHVSRREDGRLRAAAFGLFWFFIALIPESGLIPIVDIIYEHRVYLPSVGIFITIAALFSLLAERAARRSSRAANGMIAAFLSIVLILIVATLHRNSVWRSEITLWEDTARKSPRKERPLNTLGAVYIDEGLFDKALAELTKAVEINPSGWVAYVNLGTLHARMAKEAYEKTRSAGHALESMKTALRYYEKALFIDPGNAGVLSLRDRARHEVERLRSEASAESGFPEDQ